MNLKDAIQSAGSGARGAKFTKIGQIVGGVVESAELFQSRDEDGKPETWDDGGAKMKLRIIVQTELDEGTDDQGREDDGRRALYVKWWGEQKKAFLQAMEKAGLDDLVPGSKAFAKYVEDGEKAKKSWSAPKIMRYKFVGPPSVPVDEDFETDEVEDEEPPAPKRAPAKKAATKAPARKPAPKPAPEPEDDDLEGVDAPVDDTADALSEAGLDDF